MSQKQMTFVIRKIRGKRRVGGPTLRQNHRLGNPLPRRVAVLRALKLGDMLCAVPAFRALRAALPGSEVILIGLPWAREFADRFSCFIDRFVESPGFPGLPETGPPGELLPQFISSVRREKIDLAIQLHGNGSITNSFMMLLGASRNAGFFLPGGFCPEEELFIEYPEERTEIRRLLGMLDHLGISNAGNHLEFPVKERDFEEFMALPESSILREGGYVCIHPGSSDPLRRWGASSFSVLADFVADKGLDVVITGTAGEKEIARQMHVLMKRPALDLTGRTSLGALAVLILGARLLICNDTGVSHIAAALRVPSVVIFSSSDPRRWAPADRRIHRIIKAAGGEAQSESLFEVGRMLGI
jgi:ADP-heptose:LPS heptosyltransferase